MDQKMIIGIVVVVVIAVLGAPLIINVIKEQSEEQAPDATPVAAPQTPAPAPPPVQTAAPDQDPVVWQGTHTPPTRPASQFDQRQQGQGQEAQQSAGSSLNAQTLVGSAWQVDSPHGPVNVEFGPNGQGTATHQMVGTIPATWQVQGNKVIANASVMGQTINIEADIQGNTLTAQGQTIKRLR